ncbi:hypothetical protein M8542_06765 [Amycolatopsis sp. OK19-0408]|uniref:NERD domain-containing protein n=1 Tax=Amycolatopsis iheyensis TaxID=2945988 RepID=A0A9X2SH97_9PSEU|nr:hypothetical protein [Amycolatopsis iheyensis]MCR6482512.1 hypothetical protein [Amycolatopsis iheyensis]
MALQRTGAERALPPAAAHLVRLLRSWGPGPDHLTGLALAGITVPSRHGPRFVDALVFTRFGVVVIAAHELGAGVRPGERAGAGVAAAKGALAGHDGGRYVTGLVALIAPAREPGEPGVDGGGAGSGDGEVSGPGAESGGPVSGSGEVPGLRSEGGEPLAIPQPRSSGSETEAIPVVLADPRGLRRIIGQHNRWRTVWSADDVLDACYALSLAHLAPPRAALLADGFPARLHRPAAVPELPAVVTVPPEPAPEPVDEEPGPPVVRPGTAVFPRQRPIRQVPWGLLVVLTLLVTVGVIAAVFVAQVFHGS